VRVVGGADTSVALPNKTVRAKQYEIDRPDGQKRYGIWLDESGTPVKFDMVNAQGTCDFSASRYSVSRRTKRASAIFHHH